MSPSSGAVMLFQGGRSWASATVSRQPPEDIHEVSEGDSTGCENTGSDRGRSPCAPPDKEAAAVAHGLDPSGQADLAHPEGMEVDQPGATGILEASQGELSTSHHSGEDSHSTDEESNGSVATGNVSHK